MVSSALVLNKLVPYAGRRQLVKYSQSTGDIVTGIMRTHDQYKDQYDQIAKDFLAPTTLQICEKIWNFLKKNTHYVVEKMFIVTIQFFLKRLESGIENNFFIYYLDCYDQDLHPTIEVIDLNSNQYNELAGIKLFFESEMLELHG